MKSLLFLDDMQVRHGVMREICDREGVDMYSVYTADAAIHALETGKVEFDAVCLDHDLADEHYAGMYSTGGHTGRVVARWLSTSDREPLVWVHSWNPD
ncbi:MAG TPA: cyclic-phosphate processing receiver domain-containing protein, partial [Polyangiaceae bacterium]